MIFFLVFFFKQKTAYEMRIGDWSSDVCSSDLIATPTASGKSLCYTLPVVAAAMGGQAKAPASKALFLSPTKALAQDQVAELLELNRAGELGVKAFTFRTEESLVGKECVVTVKSRW